MLLPHSRVVGQGPSHSRQPSTNLYNLGLSHGLQFFRKRSSRGHKSCLQTPEWTPLSRSCQGPPAWASHRLTVSSRHPPAPGWGSPWAAEELPDTSSMTGAEVKLFSNTWGMSVSFFTNLGACTALTRSHSSLWLALLLCTKLFPFLTVLCRGHYHNTDGVSLRQSAMELAGTDSVDMGEASRSFLQLPYNQNLATQTLPIFVSVLYFLPSYGSQIQKYNKLDFNLHSFKLESKIQFTWRQLKFMRKDGNELVCI